MSEDIHVVTGLEIHVRCMHIMRFFITLQSTQLGSILYQVTLLDNCLSSVRALSRSNKTSIRVPPIRGSDGSRNLVDALLQFFN